MWVKCDDDDDNQSVDRIKEEMKIDLKERKKEEIKKEKSNEKLYWFW